MNIQTMTEIQAKTWDTAKTGRDVLGRARTGTGKTLAFLLPAFQQLLQNNQNNSQGVQVLVLSPTRELAAQIDTEGRKLTRGLRINHQVVFGGSSRGMDVRSMERHLPHVLVATPGRLKDHLQSTMVRGIPFRECFGNLKVLVLDETDRCVSIFSYCMNYI